MRLTTVVIAITAIGLGLVGATRQGDEVRVDVAQAHHREGGKELRNGCHRLYPVKRVHKYTRDRYRQRSAPLTKGQKRYIKRMRGCMYSHEKAKRARELQRVARSAFRARLAYYRLTPYVCSNGTRWAIPCYIVACESRYSWYAYNPSGASGPYQLLGWGAIYPARTWSAKMQNHRIASRVWAGGAGRGNWVC